MACRPIRIRACSRASRRRDLETSLAPAPDVTDADIVFRRAPQGQVLAHEPGREVSAEQFVESRVVLDGVGVDSLVWTAVDLARVWSRARVGLLIPLEIELVQPQVSGVHWALVDRADHVARRPLQEYRRSTDVHGDDLERGHRHGEILGDRPRYRPPPRRCFDMDGFLPSAGLARAAIGTNARDTTSTHQAAAEVDVAVAPARRATRSHKPSEPIPRPRLLMLKR